MRGKNENDYFRMLTENAAFATQTARAVQEILMDFQPDTLEEALERVHGLEYAADTAKHQMMDRLAREFITPIDREDLIRLAGLLDDVTDSAEALLRRVYMYRVGGIREETREFCELIVQCCAGVEELMAEFRNFKKSERLNPMIVDLNHLEETGDRLHARAVRRLYGTETDPVKVLAWTDLFDRMEHCCDACEDVADAVEAVVMKNL